MTRLPPHAETVVAILRSQEGDGRPVGFAVEDIDWEPALAFANDELVTPALHAAIEAGGWGDRLPSDVRAYLTYIHNLNCTRNETIRGQCIEILKAWNDAGLVPMVVKGGVAFLDNEEAEPRRMMLDLDFVFSAADVGNAIEVAEALGYRRHLDYPDGSHALTCLVRPGAPASLDVLLCLLNKPQLLPVEAVRRRSSLVQRCGIRAMVPSPEDRLVHLVLHEMVHHGVYQSGIISLRTLIDLARIARANPKLDWGTILSELRETGAHHMLRALAYATNKILGVAFPAMAIGGPGALLYYRRGMSRWHGHLSENQPRLIHLCVQGLVYIFDPAARVVPFPVKLARQLFFGSEPWR